jgi:hypothetical protein
MKAAQRDAHAHARGPGFARRRRQAGAAGQWSEIEAQTKRCAHLEHPEERGRDQDLHDQRAAGEEAGAKTRAVVRGEGNDGVDENCQKAEQR